MSVRFDLRFAHHRVVILILQNYQCLRTVLGSKIAMLHTGTFEDKCYTSAF